MNTFRIKLDIVATTEITEEELDRLYVEDGNNAEDSIETKLEWYNDEIYNGVFECEFTTENELTSFFVQDMTLTDDIEEEEYDEASWGMDYKLSTFNVESVFKFEPNFTELETQECIQKYYNNLRSNVEDNIKLRKLYISEHKDNIRTIKESIVEIEEKLNQYKKDLENINQLEKEFLNAKAN